MAWSSTRQARRALPHAGRTIGRISARHEICSRDEANPMRRPLPAIACQTTRSLTYRSVVALAATLFGLLFADGCGGVAFSGVSATCTGPRPTNYCPYACAGDYLPTCEDGAWTCNSPPPGCGGDSSHAKRDGGTRLDAAADGPTDAPADAPLEPLVCGPNLTCEATQLCVQPCCGGPAPECQKLPASGECPTGTRATPCANGSLGCVEVACTPAPAYCSDTVPDQCKRDGRFVRCVCA